MWRIVFGLEIEQTLDLKGVAAVGPIFIWFFLQNCSSFHSSGVWLVLEMGIFISFWKLSCGPVEFFSLPEIDISSSHR